MGISGGPIRCQVGIWRYMKVSSETSSRGVWGASEGFRDVLWGLKGISGTLRGVSGGDMGFHERRLRVASGNLRNVSGGFWGSQNVPFFRGEGFLEVSGVFHGVSGAIEGVFGMLQGN